MVSKLSRGAVASFLAITLSSCSASVPSPQPGQAANTQGGLRPLSYTNQGRPGMLPAGPRIEDDEIDQHIDTSLPPSERTFMHKVMLRLPPTQRDNVIYTTSDGITHSNHRTLITPPFPSELSTDAESLEREFRTPSTPQTAAPNNNCPKRSLGTPGGAFRRVYVGAPVSIPAHSTFPNVILRRISLARSRSTTGALTSSMALTKSLAEPTG